MAKVQFIHTQLFEEAAERAGRRIERGYLVDFVTGKVLRDTRKERVRQNIERMLVEIYGYPKEHMTIDFPIQLDSGSVIQTPDVVVFSDSVHLQDRAYMIIEIEPPEHKYNRQLSSYITDTPAQFAVWTNGVETLYFATIKGRERLAPINDIPLYGWSVDDIGKYKKSQLVPALDLKISFERIHNFIYVNQGLRHDQIFHEILKLIFCKVQDERSVGEGCEFRATPSEVDSESGREKIALRLKTLFSKVKAAYARVFDVSEEIVLNATAIAFAVSELQKYKLLGTDIDVKGAAFETIVGANLRGERGEYFTPRNVCRMMARILDPGLEDSLLDPACGSGGFLVVGWQRICSEIENALDRKEISKLQADELKMKAQKQIFGIDFNPLLAKTTKMNLAMNGFSSDHIFTENALAPYRNWDLEVRKRLKPGSIDKILTNPPMGAKCKIYDQEILRQFDLGHRWVQGSSGRLEKTDEILTSQVPEILFVERCLDLLKPDSGELGIVMSRGTLSNEKNPIVLAFRQWIRDHARTMAVIDLPRETFLPHTGTLTSALILRKKIGGNFDIFMGVAEKVGTDKRGNVVYRRDPSGNLVLDENMNPIKDDELPMMGDACAKFLGR